MDLTLDQAKAALADSQSGFYKNDRSVVDAVNRAFEQAHPGTHEISSGDLPPHLSDEAILGVNQPQPNPLAPQPPVQPEQQGQQTPQQGERVILGADWDDKTQQQGEESLKRLEPYRWPEILSATNDRENLKLVFGPFIDRDPANKQFLVELTQWVGHNPRVLMFYHYLIERLKGGV